MYMYLRKVISGGQTGVDQAGLEAARLCGITTGGYAPKGYRTLSGPNEKLKTVYSLQESKFSSYKCRTYQNVKMSHGTIIIAKKFSSAGTVCTKNALWEYRRLFINVNLSRPVDVQVVVDWIINSEIQILNIAGNSENTAPGIYEFALNYLTKVFNKQKE